MIRRLLVAGALLIAAASISPRLDAMKIKLGDCTLTTYEAWKYPAGGGAGVRCDWNVLQCTGFTKTWFDC